MSQLAEKFVAVENDGIAEGADSASGAVTDPVSAASPVGEPAEGTTVEAAAAESPTEPGPEADMPEGEAEAATEKAVSADARAVEPEVRDGHQGEEPSEAPSGSDKPEETREQPEASEDEQASEGHDTAEDQEISEDQDAVEGASEGDDAPETQVESESQMESENQGDSETAEDAPQDAADESGADAATESVEAEAEFTGEPEVADDETAEPAADAEAEHLSDEEPNTETETAAASDAEAASGQEPGAETEAPMDPVQRPEEFRLLEAVLFASSEPLDEAALGKRLPDGVNVKELLAALQAEYAARGVNLVRIGRKWTFRTAGDLSWLLTKNVVQARKLSRAAIETLAIIAYHQPVTRAEIEDIRGVAAAKGTLDVLLETGWVRPRGRRKVPGRPITYGTSDEFLSHFGLERVDDLPGLDELKGAGLLDGRLPPGFSVPVPSDDSALREDEDPLEPGDMLDFGLAPPPERVDDD